MGSGRRLLRNESGSLRDVMNCDRSSLKYTAFRSGIGEADQPIGRCDGPAPERVARSVALAQTVPQESSATASVLARRFDADQHMVDFGGAGDGRDGNWQPWIAALCRGLKRSACVSDIHRSPGVLHRPFVRSAATAFACRVRGRWDRRRCAWW